MENYQEPPVVKSTLPFIGHALGIIRNKFHYYVQLNQQHSLPIFTLSIPGQKIYVVTRPDLVQAIQKQSKVFSFRVLEAKFASRVCGFSQEAERIVSHNANGQPGETQLSMEMHTAMRMALSPSTDFNNTNQQLMKNIAGSLNNFQMSGQRSVKVGLSKWLRHNITEAATNAVYGPKNPFGDQGVVDAFWQFNRYLEAFVLGVFTWLTAWKGVNNRMLLSKAFEEYHRDRGHDNGSTFAKERYRVAEKNEMAPEDIAKLEVGGAVAVISNTAPASFWAVFFTYSIPGLLDDIRNELDSILLKSDTDDKLMRVPNLDVLKRECPLLMSTVQETLRYRSVSTVTRQVMEETVLSDQWLLKKDSMIVIPSHVIHMDSSIWGNDAHEFNPRRFMEDSDNDRKRIHASAFRPFGGGTTLCPGRHLATNEILMTTAISALRYDMVPAAGAWSMPSTNNTSLVAAFMEPDTDVEVEVSLRKGLEEDTIFILE